MEYEVVIGLEVHAELDTQSKIFCSCSARPGGEINEHVCPGCAGMPGLLPVMNKKVVDLGIAAGLVTNCRINRVTTFDKKNYFYPDLSCSYQITQLYAPICVEGGIEIETAAGKKTIGIKQIHMEEDAGKLIHEPWTDTSLVDYNRCSVPLVEIVSKPDLRGPEEVIAYLEKLRSLLRFAKVSRCRMEEGTMRADINLSVRPKGTTTLGVRTEMKNMNSLKAIVRAIKYETQRHIDALEYGDEELIQETRRWDDAKNKSFAMRNKENATDYRYFPNPDLPPIVISEDWIQEVKKSLPEMPHVKKEKYMKEYGLPEYDSGIITGSLALTELFEGACALCANAKEIANWIIGDGLALAKKSGQDVEDIQIDPAKLVYIVEALDKRELSRPNAKKVFAAVYRENADPAQYIAAQDLTSSSDDSLVRQVTEAVVAANPKSVEDYRGGKVKAIDFLFGQCMRQLKGKADPGLIREMLTRLLE